MQGKMKSFLEDTGIILVLAATVYGGYFTYNTFVTDEQNISTNTTEPQEKIVLLKKESLIDSNNSAEIKEIIPEVIIKKSEKETENMVKIEETIENSLPLVLEKNEPKMKKEVTKISPPIIVKEIEVKKEKNVDLAMLRIFLRNIKIRMAGNIVKRDDLDKSIAQDLKIRVTVLKDGSYEDLIFVNGDKKLFEKNKEHIVKVFPVRIDDKIKDEFPRYVRISIK